MRQTYNRELYIGLAPLVDIFDPLIVRVEAVGGQTDDLDTALGEVRLAARDLGELGRANGREVVRMREEDCLEDISVHDLLVTPALSAYPRIADPVVELDRALRRLRLKVGRDASQTQCRRHRI